ncbi:MAG: hypothetical protein L0212_08615 [Acidobacteria bacterium]|nr:hypothetical protein [Acidobacteriota bacterium]
MALAADVTWEVRTSGNDANGGGFKDAATGTDRSQQDSPHVTFDGTTVTASNGGASATITLSGYTVITGDVGNILKVTGGTNFTTGRYEVVSVDTGAGTWTLDRNVTTGAGSGMTGRMGGACASPGEVMTAFVANNRMYVKSGTYNMTSSNNVSGGRITISVNGTVAGPNRVFGYQTTRDDFGTKPVFQAASSSMTMVTLSGTRTIFDNIELKRDTAGSLTSVSGIAVTSGGGGSVLRRLKVSGTNLRGYEFDTDNMSAHDCEAFECSGTSAFQIDAGATLVRCCVRDCTSTGNFQSGGVVPGAKLLYCVADSCANEGFSFGTATSLCMNCVSYNCSGANGVGFRSTQNSTIFVNCLAVDNASSGFDLNGASAGMGFLFNCGGFNNAGGNFSSTDFPDYFVQSFQALTAQPFTDPTNGNFVLNANAGGGGQARAAAAPGVLPGLPNSTGFLDIGTYQHQDNTAVVVVNNPTTIVYPGSRATGY